jgi:hypothetical protein
VPGVRGTVDAEGEGDTGVLLVGVPFAVLA